MISFDFSRLFFDQNNKTKPKDSQDVVEGGRFPTHLMPPKQIEALDENSLDQDTVDKELNIQKELILSRTGKRNGYGKEKWIL